MVCLINDVNAVFGGWQHTTAGIKIGQQQGVIHHQHLTVLNFGACQMERAVAVGGVLTLIFVLEKLLLGDQSNRRVVRFDLVEESEGAA